MRTVGWGAKTAGADAACIIDGTGAAAASAEPPPPLSPAAAARAAAAVARFGWYETTGAVYPFTFMGANAVKTKAGAPSAASSSPLLSYSARSSSLQRRKTSGPFFSHAHISRAARLTEGPITEYSQR